MFKLGITIIFLLQNFITYTYEVDFILKVNRLVLPIGLYYFAYFFLNYKTHYLIKILGIFICYTAFQTIFTTNSDILSGHLFSDESGLLTYLSLGMLASMGIYEIFYKSRVFNKINNKFVVKAFILILLFVNFLMLQSIFSFEALFTRFAGIRFSSEKGQIDYQVIGDAYILLYFISTILLTKFYRNLYSTRVQKIPITDNIIIFLFYLSGVLACQILGSNTATVIILAFGIIFLTITLFNNFNNGELVYIPGKIYSKIFLQLGLMGILVIFGIFSLIYALELEDAFRFLNYDESSILSTSITSRFDLFGNFFATWNVNPVFGNMQADYLIYSPGQYAHSLPLSLLSHSGLIGFLLFSILLIKLSRDYFFKPFMLEIDLSELIIRFLIIIIFAFSLLATFWAWSVLWFCIGYMISWIATIRAES